jgi:carbon-monoxide dehydrogenase medium subunit
MKPAPFEYFAPYELTEALELLARYGDEAKVLAGGQSLMPLMNLRLARPKVIVDINRLSSLSFITAGSNGVLTIGSLTRQREMERSAVVRQQNPLLTAALPMIGHFQIRNRGTLGGSIAHADPAAELPAVSLILGAEFVLRSAAGMRRIGAEDFFVDYLTTALRPDELLVEVQFPSWSQGDGWAMEEVARRKGDFAIVGAALRVRVDEVDTIKNAALVLFGVAGRPVRLRVAEEGLIGQKPDQRLAAQLAKIVAAELQPESDLHASAEYRKEVGGVMARRALVAALARTRSEGKN